jgi:hypothetical protein
MVMPESLAAQPPRETATLAVPEAIRVHPDLPVTLADLETPDLPEDPATQVHQRPQLAKPLPHHHANLALKVHLAHPDNLANPATQDPMDNQVKAAAILNLVQPDPKVHLDNLETPEDLDSQEIPALLLNHKELHPDLLDHLAMPELLVNLEALDSLETTDNPVAPDPKDLPELLDNLVNLEAMGNPAILDKLEVRATKVSAQNTAPSMVVFSSKTELADRQFRDIFYQIIPTSQQIAMSFNFVIVSVFSIKNVFLKII